MDIEIPEESIILIGLLHDIARFEQYTKYKTFRDSISIDHGDLGVEILFEEKEIEKYDLDKKYYQNSESTKKVKKFKSIISILHF